jgi:AraC-like DNA-binding protein
MKALSEVPAATEEQFLPFSVWVVGDVPEVAVPARVPSHAFVGPTFSPTLPPSRRCDIYRIVLLTDGRSQLHLAGARSVELRAPALAICHPLVPLTWEDRSPPPAGLFCLFTEDFLHGPAPLRPPADSPLLAGEGNPVYWLSDGEAAPLVGFFRAMVEELASDYPHAHEVIRHYVHLLLHAGRKRQPRTTFSHAPDAAGRLTVLFLGLLERQFPIASPAHPLRLRTAQGYATALGVHLNHLNRAVRRVTGKTTTAHLANRIVQEARHLLLTTAWSTADVGYALGFECTTYFYNFFKKHTAMSPKQLRDQKSRFPN